MIKNSETKSEKVVTTFFRTINIWIHFTLLFVKFKFISKIKLFFFKFEDDGQYSRTLIELRGNGSFSKQT